MLGWDLIMVNLDFGCNKNGDYFTIRIQPGYQWESFTEIVFGCFGYDVLGNMFFWGWILDSIVWTYVPNFCNEIFLRYTQWKSEEFNSQKFDCSLDSNVLLTSTLSSGHNLEVWLQCPTAVWVWRSKRRTRCALTEEQSRLPEYL